MSTTTKTRQARRWRARHEPRQTPHKPYLLMCRAEDEDGHGGWVMVEVDGPEDGETVARALQPVANRVPRSAPTRCELVPYTDEGLHQWATASIKRRDALRQMGKKL